MRQILLILCFYLLIATPVEAQKKAVEITPAGKETIETEPRRVITAAFLVTNKTSEKQEFAPDVILPERWSLIIEDPPFELDPDESDTRFISFLVPQATLAGTYDVIYLIKTGKRPPISDSYTLHVVVLPVVKLEAKLLEAPEYVVAGDTYRATFAVVSGSNVKNTVIIEIKSGEDLPFTVDNKELELAPGESKSVIVTVRTDENMREPLKHRLELTARLFEDKQVKAQVASYVEIIPRVTRAGDRFHSIPVKVATFGHLSIKKGDVNPGIQMEVSGAGTLDEEGNKHVDFLFREPDTQGESVFGRRDELRFNFWTKGYELNAGDDYYTLSPLTESYSYGRGIRGELILNNFTVGSYYQRARWFIHEQRIAGYASYSVSSKYRIGLNYLNKGDPANFNVVSLNGQLKSIKNNDVEVECALGRKDRESDYAYLLRAYGYFGWISYILRYIRAGPDYPGSYRDTDFLSASISADLRKKFTLDTSFGQTKDNLNLDPARRIARMDRHYKLGLNYRYTTGSNLLLSFRNRNYEDRFPQPEFDYNEKLYRLEANRSFRKLLLNTFLEFGKTKDNLTDKTSGSKTYSFSTYLVPTRNQLYNGYIQYNSTGDFSGKNLRTVTARLDSFIQIGERRLFNLDLQYGEYLESEFGGWNFWEIRSKLAHTFLNRHRVSIDGCLVSSGNTESNYFMLEYDAPFRLPVRYKKGIGTVTGYVRDEETKMPLSDVIIRISSATAVCNKKGYFIFPTLKPGTYHISINTARVRTGLVASQKTPREVTVEDGKKTPIEIWVTRSASLSGRVVVYEFEGSNKNGVPQEVDETKLVESYGLANVLVELTNGTEVKQRVTDNEGYFSFEDLHPGKWTLKVYDYELPEYHYLEKDVFEFELKPDEKAEVLVKVLPKKRRVRIIEEGGTIKEEGK